MLQGEVNVVELYPSSFLHFSRLRRHDQLWVLAHIKSAQLGEVVDGLWQSQKAVSVQDQLL